MPEREYNPRYRRYPGNCNVWDLNTDECMDDRYTTHRILGAAAVGVCLALIFGSTFLLCVPPTELFPIPPWLMPHHLQVGPLQTLRRVPQMLQGMPVLLLLRHTRLVLQCVALPCN